MLIFALLTHKLPALMHLIHFVRISLVLIVVLYYSVLGNLTGKDLFSSSQQLLATKIRAKKGGTLL